MSNTAIQLKKSGVTGNTPSGLAFGEVALNYADGKLYYKNSLGGTSYINNQYSFDTINSNNSLIFAGSSSDTLSFVAGNNITITSNTTTKTITINSTSGGDPSYAFDRANAAYTHANNAYDKANSSGSFANGAFLTANSSASFANGAFVTANSAASFANGAFSEANIAYTHAEAAYAKANTGTTALDVNSEIIAFTIAFS